MDAFEVLTLIKYSQRVETGMYVYRCSTVDSISIDGDQQP